MVDQPSFYSSSPTNQRRKDTDQDFLNFEPRFYYSRHNIFSKLLSRGPLTLDHGTGLGNQSTKTRQIHDSQLTDVPRSGDSSPVPRFGVTRKGRTFSRLPRARGLRWSVERSTGDPLALGPAIERSQGGCNLTSRKDMRSPRTQELNNGCGTERDRV